MIVSVDILKFQNALPNMIKNFIITLLRQFKVRPGFYLLNITGLSIALGAFILMYEYASYELSFDRFHKNSADIYRLNIDFSAEGRPSYRGAAVFGGVGPTLKRELPQVTDAVRIVPGYDGGGILRYGDKSLRTKEIQYTESSFFSVFSYDLVEGNKEDCLSQVNQVVLSLNMANKMFGNEDALGRTIKVMTVNGESDYLVTGLFKSRKDSHFRGEVLLSLSTLEIPWEADFDTNWRFFDFNTYVRLGVGTDPKSVEELFPPIIARNRPSSRTNARVDFDLMPVTKIHLESHINQELHQNGNKQSVTFLLIVSFLILIIAFINYTNLSTAYASERGKEVGIRKTLGSGKGLLMTQFFMEAALINLLAFSLSILIVKMVSEPLAVYTGLPITDEFLQSPTFWVRLTVLWNISSLLSGYYPAFILSNFKPLGALRSIKERSSGSMRKFVVVWQFIASACLLVGAITVQRQLKLMNELPTGINTDDMLILNVPNFDGEVEAYYKSLNNLKTELLNEAIVSDVSYASDAPGEQIGWRGGSSLIGASEDAGSGMIFKLVVDKDYLSTYGFELLSGRNFNRLAENESVILNEKSLELYGFNTPEEAINKDIWFSNVDTLRVVGVVKNVYQESLREPVKPTAYIQNYMGLKYVFVRAETTNLSKLMEVIELKFEKHFPHLPFDWKLMDEQLDSVYVSENRFMKAFNLFVSLTFMICMMGLLGLVSFATKKRKKEMAVRKVLGSSVSNIFQLFFSNFVKLALIGNLIALPVIYLVADRWLNQFAFRIDFLWWAPLVTFFICLMMTLLTTVNSIIKVAKVNPVKVLRND